MATNTELRNPYVKQFIEENIEDIQKGRFEQIYHKLFNEHYNNNFVREFSAVLTAADIDVAEEREGCLYDLLAAICNEALTTDVNDLHHLLDEEPNWYGYDIYEVTDFLEQMSFNLGVSLIPAIDAIYKCPNFKIIEL